MEFVRHVDTDVSRHLMLSRILVIDTMNLVESYDDTTVQVTVTDDTAGRLLDRDPDFYRSIPYCLYIKWGCGFQA